LTIVAKLGIVFGLIALLVLLIDGVVAIEVHQMILNGERVLEEQREEALAGDLHDALEGIQRHVRQRGPNADPDETEVLALVARAEQACADLVRGPGDRDPSEKEHQAREMLVFADLGPALALLRAAIDARSPRAEVMPLLETARALAATVYGETSGEASESAVDLKRRGRAMRRVVATWSLSALAVLGGGFWLVRRTIVDPVRKLEAGARRLGRGELSLRLPVRSKDEIGDLTRELNHMAAELEGMHLTLEQRVRERTDQFLRAARLAGLGTMAAGIAHEINNPLASIASCAEGLEHRLQNGSVSRAEQEEYLQTIASEAYRAHGITSRLLEFARSEPGVSEPCDPDAILHDIQVLLRHRMEEKSVVFQVEHAPDLPTLVADSSAIKQLLLNLLSNALDASPPGGRVLLACRPRGGAIELSVEDQGPGIPLENLDRIFDPFFTTKEPGKGTGLGLAIVHRIVEDSGGRIEVENLHPGVRFRVQLPLGDGAA
jgi:signal transduction histidine kinase